MQRLFLITMALSLLLLMNVSTTLAFYNNESTPNLLITEQKRADSARDRAMRSPGARERRYMPAELIVKFKSKEASGLPAGVHAAAGAKVKAKSDNLSALHAKFRLKKMESLFDEQTDIQRATPQLLDKLKARQLRAPKDSKAKAETIKNSLRRVYKLTFDTKANMEAIAQAYEKDPEVEYAEPNYTVKALVVPDDPTFFGQWGHYAIRSTLAWDIQKGSTGTIIAIIDSGTDYNHQDLSANMWINTNEIAGNGMDDDHNGYVDDVRGWDFVGMDYQSPVEDNDPMDNAKHGTHTAGIAAAVTNNGIGIAGASWYSKIMPVKFLDTEGIGVDSGAVKAILYAVNNGADILSNSWGGYGESDLVREAMDYAFHSGCIVVTAAGNDGSDIVVSPGGLDNVIAVGATNFSNHHADFTNFGRWVDVCAPGENISSTIPGNAYGGMSGTSMATPFVSGLCALVLSQYPVWSNNAIMGQVVSTADSTAFIDPILFNKGLLGSGRINAYSALTTVPGVRLAYAGCKVEDPAGDNDQMPDPGETVHLMLKIKNTWSSVTDATVELSSAGPFAEVITGAINSGPMDGWEDKILSFQVAINQDCPQDYAIPFQVTINSEHGFSKTDVFYVHTMASPWRYEGLEWSADGECPMLRSIAADGAGRVYACEGRSMFHWYPDTRDGLYMGTRGQDGNMSWQRLGEANGFPAIYSAFDVAVSRDGSTAYAHISLGNYDTGGDDLLYKSTNGGHHWSQIANITTQFNAFPDKIVVDPTSPNKVYVLLDEKTTRDSMIQYSADGGLSWSYLYNFGDAILDLTIDPRNPATLCACASARVFKSTNGGSSWDLITLPTERTYGDKIAVNGNNICVGICGNEYPYSTGGVFVSKDGGKTWTGYESGLEAARGRRFFDLEYDYNAPNSVYASIRGMGQFKSIDGGVSWFSINSGYNSSYGYSFAQEPVYPYRMYVGDLYDMGICSHIPGAWNQSTEACLVVTPAEGLTSTGFASGEFNPAETNFVLMNDGKTTLQWSASKTQDWVKLSATTGSLAPGQKTVVNMSISASAANLPPGTYSDTVSIKNLTNSRENTTRIVNLTMLPPVYVNQNAPGPRHDGKSWETAFLTITEAVNLALPGQEVRVATGTYYETVILRVGVSLRGGYSGVGNTRNVRTYRTTIEGKVGVASRLIVDGFTINSWGTAVECFGDQKVILSNNIISGYDMGIYCTNGGSAIIINNHILDSGSLGKPYSGAITCVSTSSPVISNNVISKCTTGIYCQNWSSPIITNNTMSDCTTRGIYCRNSSRPAIANNIIAFCSVGIVAGNESIPDLANNNVHGSTTPYSGLPKGATDIDVDPMFVNRETSDLHIQAGSLCINAGTPAAGHIQARDIDGQTRVQGGVIDIGADEYWPPRADPNGTPVTLSGAIVSAVLNNICYIEADDRAYGIRVEGNIYGLQAGARINVSGTLETNQHGERFIAASSIVQCGSGSIKPLLLSCKALGGADWEYNASTGGGQTGVSGGCGLNNIGLLVRVVGKVEQVKSGCFYLSDGSGTTVKVTAPSGISLPTTGNWAAVTGISSCEKVGELTLPVLRARSGNDITVL